MDRFYDETVLGNGISVFSETMDAVRSVAVGVWFSVGSRDESADEAGMSHFLEHMLFKGTPSRTAAEISETFERMGAELNAFTSKEYTCYYARLLDQHLPEAIEVLADMIGASLLAEDAIVSEREVVLEEISRYEDTPEDAVQELLYDTLWPAHPLGRPILGRAETVSAFDHGRASSYLGGHYTTGNCVVAAAGAVNHGALVELADRLLELPAGDRAGREHDDPGIDPRLRLVTKETEQAHITLGFRGMRATNKDRFVLSIIDSILGGGMASRLFQEIREKRGLAYSVYSFHTLYQDTGQFAVYAGTRPSNAEQVIRMIQTEIERMRRDSVTAEELHRAKESIKGQIVLGLESTRNRMTRIGKAATTGAELLSLDELVRRIDQVTAEDVARVADEVLGAENVLAVIAPLEADDLGHLL